MLPRCFQSHMLQIPCMWGNKVKGNNSQKPEQTYPLLLNNCIVTPPSATASF